MDNKKITKDMTIGDVVVKFPDAVEVLMAAGVHCVGCGASTFESIEQGLKVHGMSDEDIEAVVDSMNEAVDESEKYANSIRVTSVAIDKIKEIMKNENKEDGVLRVSVSSSGCCGYQYNLEFEKESKTNDEVIEKDGVKIVLDSKSFKLLKGAKINYVDNLHGSGFQIINPNQPEENCGDNCSC